MSDLSMPGQGREDPRESEEWELLKTPERTASRGEAPDPHPQGEGPEQDSRAATDEPPRPTEGGRS